MQTLNCHGTLSNTLAAYILFPLTFLLTHSRGHDPQTVRELTSIFHQGWSQIEVLLISK